MLKYIGYCRKSTDEKDKQVLSIEAQIAELSEFAKRENLHIVEFVTEAKTAKSPGREKFNNILKKVEAGEANAILSWHPDRLARNSIDGGKIIYLLDLGKLQQLKFPSFWFENTPQGKFMLNIAFGQSKYYVDNLSENVKRGNRQKLRRGEFPGKAPFGYLNNPKTRTIDVDLETSKVIKKAFQQFAQGNKTFTDISLYLSRFGLTRKNGKPIKVDRVKQMLSSKFYIGLITYAGELHEATHKCFISKDLFQKVQKQIEKTERHKYKGHNFAFTNLATCGECGASITGETHTKYLHIEERNETYIYYRCTKKLKICSQKYISQSDLESQVRDVVASCGLHPDWEPYFHQWIDETQEKESLTLETQLVELNEKTKGVDLRLNKLLDGYLDQCI